MNFQQNLKRGERNFYSNNNQQNQSYFERKINKNIKLLI